MNKVANRRQEAIFYRYEQQSLRKQDDTDWSEKLFSFLYEKFSNYGQSLKRPIFSLFVVYTLSMFIFSSIKFSISNSFDYFNQGAPDFLDRLALMVRFTTFNITSPFRVWTGDYPKGIFSEELIASHGLLINIVASIQSVLSLSLITLFLLTLRRTFKLN